jgi:hypothetical protein
LAVCRKRGHWRRIPPDLAAGVAIIILVFACKASILDAPYYWDEAGWVGAARWLSEQSLLKALPGLRPAAAFWGHPPGLHVLLASLFKLFGDSPVVAHLLAVSFACLGVYFTYRLGSELYDRAAGACAALALFFSPVYFAQSGMFLADLPVAAVGVAAIHFALRKAYAAYLLSAIPLVLIKETGAAVVASLLLFLLVTNRRQPRQAIREVMRYGVPLAVIGGFVLWQKLVAGQFFFIYGQPFQLIDMGARWWSKAWRIARFVFGEQLRFLLSLLILVAIGVATRWRRRPELLLFGTIFVAACAPFAFIYYLRRYLIPALPFFYILGMGALAALIRRPAARLAAAAALIALSLGSLSESPLRGNAEWNMAYLDVVRTAQAMYAYVQERHPNARVLAVWPDSLNLQRPYIGYVKRPANVVRYTERTQLRDFDVLLLSAPSNSDQGFAAYAARHVSSGALQLVKRVEKNGIISELYAKPPGSGPPIADVDSHR